MHVKIKKITFKPIVFILLVIFATAALCVVRYFFYPDIAHLKTKNPQSTSFIKYRERQWEKKKPHRATPIAWVAFGNISHFFIEAVIVSEDASFWKHHGFDFPAMRSAFHENIEANDFKYGASTISQQLAKNLYLNPSKNIIRKFEEAMLTWRLERTLPKKRILEIYCNVIEFGDGIFGIGQAAAVYYHKTPSDLTAQEAAQLAAIIPNPLKYHPCSNSRYLQKRTAVILEKMQRKRSRGTAVTTPTDSVTHQSEDTSMSTDSVAAIAPDTTVKVNENAGIDSALPNENTPPQPAMESP
jgi:monofunctional glycosyltransferase